MKDKLFNLNLCNPKTTVFPNLVFKEPFDCHYFMWDNMWFNEEADYKMLQNFLVAIGEPYLYCSVPDFKNCPNLRIDISKNHAYFEKRYLLKDKPKHPNTNIGLRISGESFWYGKTRKWAMVDDIINNIIIVGLKQDVVSHFQTAFEGKYFDIEEVVKNMEKTNKMLNKLSKTLEIDNKKELLMRYTCK